MIDADCSECDSNDLCLGKTVSWSSNTQWIYTKALPDFIKATSKYDSTRWAIKRSQHIFVYNFVKNQRILIQFSQVDFIMKGTCESVTFT